MLTDVYYAIRHEHRSDNHYEYSVELNPASKMQETHFTANLMSAGSCNMNLVSEFTSHITGCRMEFTHLDKCRFFSVLRPNENRDVVVDIHISPLDRDRYSISAEVTDGEGILFELSGSMLASAKEAA